MKDPLLNCFLPLLFIIGTNFFLIPVMNHNETAMYSTMNPLLELLTASVIMNLSVFKVTQT